MTPGPVPGDRGEPRAATGPVLKASADQEGLYFFLCFLDAKGEDMGPTLSKRLCSALVSAWAKTHSGRLRGPVAGFLLSEPRRGGRSWGLRALGQPRGLPGDQADVFSAGLERTGQAA